MALALAAIGMMFMAFTSAYVVRQGLDTGWHSVELPPLLWLNTAIIVGSSVALEMSRRLLKRGAEPPFKLWFSAAMILGLGFLAGQIAVWAQLRSNGVYVSTTPHSSFFYVMTVAHAVHLVGGLMALGYILFRGQVHTVAGAGRIGNRQLAVDVTALYWHFLAVLWIYLFIVLFVWR
jgi:cytochrome c oxidase subunit 3